MTLHAGMEPTKSFNDGYKAGFAACRDAAAEVARNHCFGRDIEWWLTATKKEVAVEACRSVAAALRAALGNPMVEGNET